MTCTAFYTSPVGPLRIEADDDALTGLWFDDTFRCPTCDNDVIRDTRRWLDVYFSGKEPGFTPDYRLSGTPFQQAVWRILATIPYGATVSYGDISAMAGKGSPRAVGGAVHRNPIGIILPCHRVVGADGSMTGYAGGIDRKISLLRLEKYGHI